MRGIRQLARRVRSDDGFGLVELVTAVSLLAVFLVVSLGPVLQSLKVIDETKVIDVAENLGQARVEAVRALAFEEVGTVGGNPDGSLPAGPQTLIHQGVRLQVTYTVSWVGSLFGFDSNNDGVADSDGVPGYYDPGVDYKWLQVTVTDTKGRIAPIVFDTIVAPPNLGAKEGFANVVVTLDKYEPVGTPSAATDWPYPVITLPSGGGTVFGGPGNEATPVTGETGKKFVFVGLTPPTVPTQKLVASMPTASPWVIRKVNLTALNNQTTLAKATTATIRFAIYQQAAFDLRLTNGVTGLPITTSASVSINLATVTETTSSGSVPGWNGRFLINMFNAVKMEPGSYNITVTAPGYQTRTFNSSQVGGGETKLIDVELEPNSRIEVVDADNRPIHGAQVVISSAAVNATMTTNLYGGINPAVVNGQNTTLTVTSPYGHQAVTLTYQPNSSTRIVTLPTPAGRYFLKLDNNDGGNFLIWPNGSSTSQLVKANNFGEASAAVLPGTWWASKQCISPVAVVGTDSVVVPGTSPPAVYGDNQAICG